MSTTVAPSPLPAGPTLDRGFALLRRHARALLVPQVVLHLIPLAIAIVATLIGFLLLGDVATKFETVRESTWTGDSTLVRREVAQYTDGQWAVLVAVLAVSAVAFAWFQVAAFVAVVRGTERVEAGQASPPPKDAVREALGQTPRLFALGVVFLLGLAAAGAVAGLVVLAVGGLKPALMVLAIVGALIAFVLVRLCLWPIAHLSEGTGLASFSRAWTLTRAQFWPLALLLLLLLIVVAAVTAVLGIVTAFLPGGIAQDDSAITMSAVIPYAVTVAVTGIVATAVLTPALVLAYRTLRAAEDGEDGPTAGEAVGSTESPTRGGSASRIP